MVFSSGTSFNQRKTRKTSSALSIMLTILHPSNNVLCVFRAEASLQSGFRKWPGRAGGRRWWRWAGEKLHPPEPCASRGCSRRHCGHLRSQHAQLHRLTWVPQCTALREHGAGQDEAGDQQVAFIVMLYSCRTSLFAVRSSCGLCELFIAFVPKLNLSDARLLEQLLEKEREYQTILQQVLEEREQEIRLLRLRSEPAGLYFHPVSFWTPSACKQHHLCSNSSSHFTNGFINREIEAQE